MKNIVKKIIPYLLILIVLVGVFGFAENVGAQSPDGKGTCYDSNDKPTNLNQEQCGLNGENKITGAKAFYWIPAGSTTPSAPITAYDKCIEGGTPPEECSDLSGRPEAGPKSDFETYVTEGKYKCGLFSGSLYPGCFVQLFYGIFYTIPAGLLWLSAYFFNVLISITLYSNLFANSEFIPRAWGVVRDLSNIFFILILLYIAIKIILDLAGHEAKKMIVKVIVIALLINFSMFFTQVIIDTSNVLALIFYNKLEVDTKNPDGHSRPYTPVAGEKKDVSGGMVNAFNPTSLLTTDFMKKAGTVSVPNQPPIPGEISPGMLILILVVAGSLMLFAAYCFFVAGISFVGRMIELFVLIIFSPFAFMSSTIPILSSVEYLGWDAWFKRLLKTAFMAPIFMFFMYFIFMLIQSKIFDQLISKKNGSVIETILLLVIPALVILILLLKATEYAKKGSGALGEKLMAGAKLVGGIALGAATGGAALGAISTAGAFSNKVAQNEGLKEKSNEKGMGGWAARTILKGANYGSRASFDVRKSPLGTLISKSGIDMNRGTSILRVSGKATEQGYKGRVERTEKENKEKDKKAYDNYKTTMTDDEVKKYSEEKHNEWEKNGKVGQEPKMYKSAAELNLDRQKKYVEGLGKTGLMYSVAYSTAKKAYKKKRDDETPEETAKGIEKLAGKIKVGLGLAAAGIGTALGGIGGLGTAIGDVAGVINAAGAGVASALGASSTVAGMAGAGAVGGTAGVLGSNIYGSVDTNQKGRHEATEALKKEVKEKEEKVRDLNRTKENKKNIEEKVASVEKELAELNKGRPENEKEKYDEYVVRKLSEIEDEMEDSKIKKKDIKQKIEKLKENNAKTPSPSFESELRSLETEMSGVTLKYSKYVIEKRKYEIAKTGEKELERLGKREHSIKEDLKGKPVEYKSKDIPKPSNGGGEHKEEHKEEHPPKAPAGGGGDSHAHHG